MDRSPPRLNWLFKCWAAFLMGDLDKGLDHLEAQRKQIGKNAFIVKCNAVRCLPHSTVRQVCAHPRHKAMLEWFGVTDAWRDELFVQVNELTPITGIRVRPDEVV